MLTNTEHAIGQDFERVFIRILIIEDEIQLVRTLADMATQDGYAADITHDGINGLDCVLTGVYDAIVLDVMLPEMNGFEILKHMRGEKIAAPVRILTARAELTDRVQGLDSVADYYHTKSFENAEFRAFLHAVLRRQVKMIPKHIVFSDLTLIPSDSRLSCVEQSLRLSTKEMEILQLLIRNRRPCPVYHRQRFAVPLNGQTCGKHIGEAAPVRYRRRAYV